VLSLADTLGLERFFVGGNSLGGMIAIDMLRLAPNRISGAISIEGWTHWTVSQDAFDSDTSSTLNDRQRAFLEQVRHSLLDRWDPELRAEYGTMWKHWDGWDTLATTSIPVLEIWGDRGRPRPSRDRMRIPDRENIELAWIPGASHHLLTEAPDRLAEFINGFMRRVSGKAG
jgi:pimeloyl-ACP methyl ester carboxylesterase